MTSATDPIQDLETLRAGQLGKCAGLVALVARRGVRLAPVLDAHYRLLAVVQRQAPEAVADLLRHPQVNAWAAYCLRRLDAGTEPLVDLEHLGAIAAAAAIRAGYPCSIRVRLRDGAVMFPSLGRARLADPPDDHGVVTVEPGAPTVLAAGTARIVLPSDPHTDAGGWTGLRRLRAGDKHVFLEDLDPYRGYAGLTTSGRLDARTAARWQTALDEAWRLLRTHHTAYVGALDAAWTSLVPLELGPADRHLSADSADAFGAIAVSGPPSAVSLATSLIHEFQHAKLNALHDIDPLFRDGGESRFYAPWRPDPRPVGPLLHGIYAHLGVTGFWRMHRRVATGNDRHVAEVEFARWLTQTLEAARRLDGCEELTPRGAALLSRTTEQLTAWLDDSVPARTRAVARSAAADHWAGWRLRNLEPCAEDVERLAAAWSAGDTAVGVVRCRLRTGVAHGRSDRPDLLYQGLRDPAELSRAAATRAGDPDVAYARGDHSAAADGYRARIASAPGDRDAWTGLGLTLGRPSVLLRRPEVAYALYHRIAAAQARPPGMDELIGWLEALPDDRGQVGVDSMLHSPRTPVARPATTSGWSAPSTSS